MFLCLSLFQRQSKLQWLDAHVSDKEKKFHKIYDQNLVLDIGAIEKNVEVRDPILLQCMGSWERIHKT